MMTSCRAGLAVGRKPGNGRQPDGKSPEKARSELPSRSATRVSKALKFIRCRLPAAPKERDGLEPPSLFSDDTGTVAVNYGHGYCVPRPVRQWRGGKGAFMARYAARCRKCGRAGDGSSFSRIARSWRTRGDIGNDRPQWSASTERRVCPCRHR
jgi:hypothetical protein